MELESQHQKEPLYPWTRNNAQVMKRVEKNLKKKLIKTLLQPLILDILARQGKLHGYGLMDAIEEQFGVRPSPGDVYSLLYRMGTGRLLDAKDEVSILAAKARKSWSLTEQGKAKRDFLAKSSLIKRVVSVLELPKKGA